MSVFLIGLLRRNNLEVLWRFINCPLELQALDGTDDIIGLVVGIHE